MLLILLPVQLAHLVWSTSSWISRRSLSALPRLLRLRALRCLALEKKVTRFSPLALHLAEDLGNRGGGERNKVLGRYLEFPREGHFDRPLNVFLPSFLGFHGNFVVVFVLNVLGEFCDFRCTYISSLDTLI